ncbi:hypothetical protein RBU61_10105 [Tissierella sp. MB52-C2]|uniref:hypothetical protein n=1 Tax=Tissierella sp. MB52-C2 TaxID=3070999 RepID=UPI00280B80C3|nr:hypothetical protein [Tissierella sp. MB52-C2]WMM23308.1 hypothetical protein RBU61_10105 [Tissierella sp. MB52-C2]
MKKNLADRILGLIIGLNIIVFLIFIFFYIPMVVYFINICVFLLVQFVAIPINEYVKKDVLKNNLIIFKIIIRIGLILILIISLYKIILSRNYNLKYTYWICLIAFGLILFTRFIERLVKDYKERKLNEKKHNKLYIATNILIATFIIGVVGYNIGQSYIHPKRDIYLNNIKVPECIVIYKHDANESRKTSLNLNTNIKIESLEDLEKITMELNSKVIKSITTTDLFNYERMRSDNSPYYLMSFHYEDSINTENRLENGYISFIIMTSNGNTAIGEINRREDFIFGNKYYNEIFPISFSEETVNMIFTYLD